MNGSILQSLPTIISLFLGMVGTYLAVRSFYEKQHKETLDRFATAKQREYAAQRDFEHLQRNQEQLKQALAQLDDELQDSKESLKEIKGMLTVLFSKSGESVSGFFNAPDKR